jgi:O-antigen biosynthesis protein WbqP
MSSRILAFLLLLLLSPLFLLIGILIITDDGFPVFFRQKRIGIYNTIFIMYKFRTMRNDTPDVATHLLEDPEKYVLKIGKILRRLSVDEFPNLLNIIKGEMNFVGPRPALYNQYDLLELRTKNGIHSQKPGLTGWAQINGRDEISIEDKVVLETWYKQNCSWQLNVKIIINTLLKSFIGKGVTH